MYDFHRNATNRKCTLLALYIVGGILLVSLVSCNPHNRFIRLIKHNPYLLEIYRSDSVKIQTFQSTDTLLFFKSQTDTLRTENTIIYRDSNTIRLVRYERPCTTYFSKSINIPSKEKVIKETQYKNDWGEILKWICILISLLGLFNLVSKWKA